MGNGSSTTNTTVQDAVSSIMMDILVSNTQNCSASSEVVQSISASAGNNSAIVITDNKIDSHIKSQLTCLMTAQLTQSSLSQIQSELQNSIANSSIMFPNITSATTNNNLKQSFASYVSTNVNMSNVLSAAQTANIRQQIVASGGNNSSIIISGNDMEAGIELFTQACTDAATSALQKFASSVIGSGTASTEEVNALKPFADTAMSLGHDAANIAASGFSALSNTYKFMVFMVVMIVVIIIAMLTGAGSFIKGLFKKKGADDKYLSNTSKTDNSKLLKPNILSNEPIPDHQLKQMGLKVLSGGNKGSSLLNMITGNP